MENAYLDVRVLPWRPRPRVMKPDTLRDTADPFSAMNSGSGVVLGLALWLVIIIAAPVIVLVLAAALISIELPIVLVLAIVLLVVRFVGLVPWTVVVVDRVTGDERRESHRAWWRALRRIRDVNHDRRVRVRWSWS